jgi:polyphosphate kinase 2 (PPK2 family)
MGYCTEEQYKLFMSQVNQYEKMIVDSGVELIKLWFAVSRDEQKKRFDDRKKDPLKMWKLSPVDEMAQKKWDVYTKYIKLMLENTDTKQAPWAVIDGNDKYQARLESIRHVLSELDYEGKKDSEVSFKVDRKIVFSGQSGIQLVT